MKQLSAWDVVRLAYRRAKGGTWLTVLMVSVHQVCEATTPVIVGLALDDAIAEGSVEGTLVWVLGLAGVYVVLSLCGNGAGPVAIRASTRAEHDLRQLAVTRVLDPRGMARSRSTGETLSIVSSDAAVVGSGVDGLAWGVSGLAALVVATVALFYTSVTLGLVAVACVVVVVFVAPLLARPLQQRSAAQQDAAARSAGVAVDMVEGLRVLGGLGAQANATDRYRLTSEDSRKARIRAGAAEAVFESVTSTIGGGLLVAVAAVGAYLTLDGDLTPGQLVAGVGLAQFLIGPVSRISYAGVLVATVRASARRIADLLNTPYAVTDVPSREPGVEASLDLAGLGVRVEPGELVGLVIDDLAERAELLDALARRRPAPPGAVLVGGVPVEDLGLEDLHRLVAVVPHDGSLFTEPLSDLVGDEPERYLAAARATEVAAVVGEHGSVHGGRNLSGGQRQRLSLARALAADPPVLVLDDPTSALDPVTESEVAAGLRELRRGRRTTVVVTASAVMLAAADRVVLVQGGAVRAEGTHAELAADERYAGVVLA